MDFERFWNILCDVLKKKQTIKNWTQKRNYFGENFEAVYEGGDYIKVILPNGNNLLIPKLDFLIIFHNWDKYLKGKVLRSYFAHGRIARSRFTKYTISIIKMMGVFDD